MSAAHATGAEAPNTAEDGLKAELANKCLYYMSLMREIEDRIERKLYRQGKIVGGVYVGRGQEAIPVGSALCAGPDDVLLPSHRDMAVFLIRGVSARRILAQYMGRDGRAHPRPRRQHAHGRHEGRGRLDHQRAGGHGSGGGRRRPGAALPGERAASPSAISATAPPAAATGMRA